MQSTVTESHFFPSTLLLFVIGSLLINPQTCAAEDGSALTENVRSYTSWEYDGPSRSSARTSAAQDAKGETVKALFAAAEVTFPPHKLLLRVFKDEDLLEVWAGDDGAELSRIAQYEICAASGSAGPKRKQGDGQVPEGFYTIDAFNDHSSYYLSMKISYPNRSDRILGHRRRPGSAIMIHGNCVSIGCLAMSDERMQEIWVMSDAMRRARRTVNVHIFPGRDLDTYIEEMPNHDLKDFWRNLREGYRIFEKKRLIPRYRINSKGRYIFSESSSRP